MRQTNVRGSLSLRGFRKLRTGAIVATGVILLGLGFLAPTVSASEQDGVWVARTVEEVKADILNIDNLSHYTIKWGDTLSAISGATGLSVDSLVEINRIANRDLIFANNKLYFSEEAFLKDGNTEVKRQRVSIDNSGSRQSYEVETKTDTVTGEQRTTVKQTTPVAVEIPAASAEKAEESVLPASKSETSVSVAPKAETRSETLHAPSADTTIESGNSTESSPVVDKALSNIGTTNQPVVSNPSSEAPAPKVEEPMVSEPKSEEPATPAPKVEEPVSPAPKAEEPATLAPEVEEPATPAPKADEPTVSEPKSEAPVSPAPKVEEPTVSEPKAEAPATPAPKAEEPMVSEPRAEAPAAPAPKAEEPMVSEPKSEAPATPAPKAEEPMVSEPRAEAPAAPAPKSEAPASPAPKSEAPVATRPTTEDSVTPKGEAPAVPQKEVQTVFKSEVSQASAGNVLVGIKGEFLTPDQQAILDSLNKIRKEAFEEKLVDKYVPIKWSTQLEKTALMRAAESSITNAHARLSDKNIWTAFPTGTRTFGENLAWNYKGFAEAIKQWYSEKADYIKKSKGETVAGQTGHYKSLINPLYTYTGLGAFNNPRHEHHWITVAQILGDKVDSEALVGQYGPAIQEAEVTESQLSSFKTKADIVENISDRRDKQ
ncbi:CAP domain-containing protein [Streptococcus pseudopneumoniae]|uniref:CAP domain-containing protein n=1 Tax=Streptococcus pseudopneumoniae TaxID=257758 RepID=UPI001C66128A|nr:CAP domain-containing protein [Streptococcus pseudopneumoniae]MBW8118895.1 LysM peptidoglycan-binding domain-containing protein [Streptococcus pseudopneumoniae]